MRRRLALPPNPVRSRGEIRMIGLTSRWPAVYDGLRWAQARGRSVPGRSTSDPREKGGGR